MNDNRKIKAQLKHAWKYHRASTIQYCLAGFLTITMLFCGAALVSEKILLDPYVLQFIAIAGFGICGWIVFSKSADVVYDAEQKKEQLSLHAQDKTEAKA